MKSPDATRRTLLARLSAAAGLHLGSGHKDSCEAVKEAQEVIRAMPFADDINAALYPNPAREASEPLLMGNMDRLRELRQWHYSQYADLTSRANDAQKKSDSRMFESSSRNDFERVANGYRTKANQHLRFVRTLNDFFPSSDKVV